MQKHLRMSKTLSNRRRIRCGQERAPKAPNGGFSVAERRQKKKEKRLNRVQEVLCGMRNEVIPTTLAQTPRACPTAAAPSEAKVSRFS